MKNVSLTLNDISNKKWDRLFSKVLKSHENINDLLPILFKRLATDIIVKESRWTWIK